MKPIKAICVSGKAGSGKDTFARMLRHRLENAKESVVTTHFGDAVKMIAKNIYDWDGKKDEDGRALLQFIGTDLVRKQEPDFWAEFVARSIKLLSDDGNWDYVLIPDWRFPNEAEVLERFGIDVVTVRVVSTKNRRFMTNAQLDHESENALDGYNAFDYIVINDDLGELHEAVSAIAYELTTGNKADEWDKVSGWVSGGTNE